MSIFFVRPLEGGDNDERADVFKWEPVYGGSIIPSCDPEFPGVRVLCIAGTDVFAGTLAEVEAMMYLLLKVLVGHASDNYGGFLQFLKRDEAVELRIYEEPDLLGPYVHLTKYPPRTFFLSQTGFEIQPAVGRKEGA